MKVIIPIQDLHLGGGCKVLVDTANALLTKGHDVEIVIPQSSARQYTSNCKETIVPTLSKEYIPYGDIILTNFFSTFPPSYAAWPNKCVRYSLGFEPYWVVDKTTAVWSYSQNVPIVSISNWLANQIKNHVGKRGLVVNLGVDPKIFYPNPNRRVAASKVILYIARNPMVYTMKGYHDFVAAINILKTMYNLPFSIHMICPEVPLGVPGTPHLVLRANNSIEMAHFYRNVDVFVSTSWFEGFSLPPLEAMACGTPVVTTDSGGVLDYCVNNVNSVIVPPRNPKMIAQGIMKVLSNPVLANQLVVKGLETARRLTKESFEKNIVDTIEYIYMQKLYGLEV